MGGAAFSGVGRWLPVVAVAIALIPVGLLVAALLAGRSMRRGTPRRDAWVRAFAEVGMVLGTLPWLWMILTPTPAPRELRPVPLLDIARLISEDLSFAFVQVVGNLLVFAAFGLLAPLRWGLRPAVVLALAVAGSAVAETLQWVLNLGRVTSVDDVLLNGGGAGLAALIAWNRLREYLPATPLGDSRT
jgi:hypothetical protein